VRRGDIYILEETSLRKMLAKTNRLERFGAILLPTAITKIIDFGDCLPLQLKSLYFTKRGCGTKLKCINESEEAKEI
jgi:hypothetical protein